MTTIRVVDDTADMATLLADYFQFTHPDVTVLATVDGFPRLLSPDPWEGVDIAVLDVMLPGITGVTIAGWLAHHLPHIRRVIWTASTIADDPELTKIADRVIRKGTSMADLAKAILGG